MAAHRSFMGKFERSEARGYFAFFLLLPLGRIEEALNQLRRRGILAFALILETYEISETATP